VLEIFENFGGVLRRLGGAGRNTLLLIVVC